MCIVGLQIRKNNTDSGRGTRGTGVGADSPLTPVVQSPDTRNTSMSATTVSSSTNADTGTANKRLQQHILNIVKNEKCFFKPQCCGNILLMGGPDGGSLLFYSLSGNISDPAVFISNSLKSKSLSSNSEALKALGETPVHWQKLPNSKSLVRKSQFHTLVANFKFEKPQ